MGAITSKSSYGAPGYTELIGGNGVVLEIIGLVNQHWQIGGRVVYQECESVQSFPRDFIVGGEFLKPHACTLQ